jgi:hypothetical protein
VKRTAERGIEQVVIKLLPIQLNRPPLFPNFFALLPSPKFQSSSIHIANITILNGWLPQIKISTQSSITALPTYLSFHVNMISYIKLCTEVSPSLYYLIDCHINNFGNVSMKREVSFVGIKILLALFLTLDES